MIVSSYNFNGSGSPFAVTGTGYAESGGFGVFTAQGGGLEGQAITLSPGILSTPAMLFTIYFKISSASNLNFMIGLTEASGVDHNNLYALYAAGAGKFYPYDGSTGAQIGTLSADTLYKVTLEARPNFYMNLYVDDVLLHTSVNKGSGYDTTGRPLYLNVLCDTVGSGGTLSVATFSCDNRQEITNEISLSEFSGFSEFSTENLGTETTTASMLLPHTTYYFRNALEVAGDLSAYSDTVQATTQGSVTTSGDGENLLVLGEL